MRIIVLGAKGNLGHQLVRVGRELGHEVMAVDREDADLSDLNVAYAIVRDGHFDLVFNAVAWNDVDGAEREDLKPIAWRLNADLPGVLAAAAHESGASFVHYSTDFVFAGDRDDGYAEDDEPIPVSEYGRSKLAGERAVLAVGGDCYVCRTSKLFGPKGLSEGAKPSFVDIMINLSKTKPELSIVHDEVGCPTCTADLAEASYQVVLGSYSPGIYHLVNSGPGVTWYEFAEEFFGLMGIGIPRRPVGPDQFPRPAVRPSKAFLKNVKYPHLRQRIEALRHHLAESIQSKANE